MALVVLLAVIIVLICVWMGMGKTVAAMVLTTICGLLGMVIGDELMGGYPELGCIIAIAVTGAFIIYFNEEKKNPSSNQEKEDTKE